LQSRDLADGDYRLSSLSDDLLARPVGTAELPQ
jgi:hypothetical protein